MRFESIAEILDQNDRIHQRFEATLNGLGEDKMELRSDDGGWNVREIVEHVSIVEASCLKIASKLLTKARESGASATPSVELSESFLQGTAASVDARLEAPEFVHPTGDVSIAESLERMTATGRAFHEMETEFAGYGCSDLRFPHPYFGPMSAVEWLVLVGGHKARHLRQITRLIGPK
jgi:hypothetical protein